MSLLVLHQNSAITHKQELDVAQSIQFMLVNLANKLTVQQLAGRKPTYHHPIFPGSSKSKQGIRPLTTLFA